MTLKEVEPLHLYQWLLLPSQRAEVETWTPELLGSGKGLKRAAPAPVAESSSSSNRAKRSKTAAAANEDVNSLFS